MSLARRRRGAVEALGFAETGAVPFVLASRSCGTPGAPGRTNRIATSTAAGLVAPVVGNLRLQAIHQVEPGRRLALAGPGAQQGTQAREHAPVPSRPRPARTQPGPEATARHR